ncbi:MAG: hypothetical protein O4859_05790 [Trichodesmium sp. St18_bin1]|jgi:hypothetical protein|nr:hypothetical protein [Trichodesmium sp. St18_bin1]
MFRDFKKGGLNQEGTQVKGERLIAILLLITLAYSQSLIAGKIISQKGVVNGNVFRRSRGIDGQLLSKRAKLSPEV